MPSRRNEDGTSHLPRKRTRSEKREHAFELFERGFSNADVARIVGLSKNTSTAYRRMYEDTLNSAVDEDPGFLRDVVGNTMRQLHELEQIRKAAWSDYERSLQALPVFCPHCHERNEVCDHCGRELSVIVGSPKDKQANLKLALSAQKERATLFGVVGIKAEFLAMVQQVKAVQDFLLDFIQRELCATDRAKIDNFLSSPEMSRYMGVTMPALDTDSLELPA